VSVFKRGEPPRPFRTRRKLPYSFFSGITQLPSSYIRHRTNRSVSIVLAYSEAWLRGIGCIPLNHHMEDAATAEISRAQIWQWKHHGVKTEDDGEVITAARISKLVHEEVKGVTGGEDRGKWYLAGKLVSAFSFFVVHDVKS
jgi:malate synthase